MLGKGTGLAGGSAAPLKYGPNALEEKRKSELAVFLAFFWGPIPWMIEAAAIMSLVVKDYGDFTIIAGLAALQRLPWLLGGASGIQCA